MKLPRIMIAAPKSGSGKTLVTCGLLQMLINRGKKVSAFKCGPDYIDPMFHREVIGVPSGNLDTFFASGDVARYLLCRHAKGTEISVLEGVMGYYDGISGVTPDASSWDVADATDTPVLLVVNARGMSLSVIPLIQGFLSFSPNRARSEVGGGGRSALLSGVSRDVDIFRGTEDNALQNRKDNASGHIRGVILNRISPSSYPRLKQEIERLLPVKVFGYVPRLDDCVLESRHLGLVTPGEVAGFREKLQHLAGVLETSLDIKGILELAGEAPDLSPVMPKDLKEAIDESKMKPGTAPRIAVARDEAFCFYYEDNLEILKDFGGELVFFSPIRDRRLPDHTDGLLIGGGYPELYAGQLSENREMLKAVGAAIENGLPCLAECGGFLYLHDATEDMDGESRPMVGAIRGKARKTERAGSFGYITLSANRPQIFGDAGARIRGHEFHYFESSAPGEAFRAKKPYGSRSWECMQAGENFAAGFPHLYYYSNPEFAANFLRRAAKER